MTAAVEVLTFGCRLNGVESERMRDHAIRAGERDLTIVNTCAVTAEAARQARQAIRRIGRDTPGRRVVVTGCASETDPLAFQSLPGVDRLLPNATKSLPETWGIGPTDPSLDGSPSRQTRGFVEIQNGCDHRCTFCIIPFGRGSSRSIHSGDVVARTRALVEHGVQEVVLTGVDLTSYGQDLPDRPSLGRLARDLLAAVPDLPRLRLSSLDCLEIDRDLLDLLAGEPRLMPHLHLSLQAGADLVLKRMKRRHSRDEAIRFCRAARALRPDVSFGADFIAGFPTETEAMFGETLALADECDVSFVHAFPYSARPGTAAARMPAVPEGEVRDRAARLRAHAAVRLSRHLDARVGQALDVLTERGSRAHAADFTAVRFADPVEPGRLRRVVADGHDGRALVVKTAPASQHFGNPAGR